MEDWKMTYEEFKRLNSEFDDQIKILMDSKKDLKKEYIKQHQEFKVGDKVHCWIKSWTIDRKDSELKDLGLAFISGINEITYSGAIRYKFAKVKKDGTMSGQSAGFWNVDKIELVKD